MSYGRFRRDPCGNLPAPKRACERCFRMFLDAARERAMKGHTCPACIERQRGFEQPLRPAPVRTPRRVRLAPL